MKAPQISLRPIAISLWLRLIISLIFIPLLCISCSKKPNRAESNPDLIEIDLQSVPSGGSLKLSDIAKEVIYIPLETKTESYLNQINEIVFTDSCILIEHWGQIKIFSSDGKFIRELYRVGKGPRECYARSFTISDQKRTILVYNNFAHKINEYRLIREN